MVNNFGGGLFPNRCVFCGARGRQEDLCAACAADLPTIERPCERCGLPLEGAAPFCGSCLQHPPPFIRCVSPLLYQAPVSQLVTAFKYGGHLAYGRVLAALLRDCLCSGGRPAVDVLLPVPLHWRRRWARGFNQSEIVADELGRALGLPVRTRWLRRPRATAPQQGLTAAERTRNLRGAFSVRRLPAGVRVALIDDVVTTGATAGELSRLLLAAGAASVEVWCLARTPAP